MRFWPFKRRSPAAPAAKPALAYDLRGLNEDWQIGDLAECLIDQASWRPPATDDPARGEVRRVAAIVTGLVVTGEGLITALKFEHFDKKAWHCINFRKLRPELVAADQQFTASIRKLGKVPADAVPS